jgi:hypothetical protein
MSSLADSPRAVNGCQPARKSRSHGVARLTLSINGVAYSVRPILITGAVATRLFRLRKADGTTHLVTSTLDGLSCDCDAYTFRHNGIDANGCEHLNAMVAVRLCDSPKGGAQ